MKCTYDILRENTTLRHFKTKNHIVQYYTSKDIGGDVLSRLWSFLRESK